MPPQVTAAPGYDSRSVQSAAIQNILAGKAANAQAKSAKADMMRASVAEKMLPYQQATAAISGITDVAQTGANLWTTYHNVQGQKLANDAAALKLETDKMQAPMEFVKTFAGTMGNVIKLAQTGEVNPAQLRTTLEGLYSNYSTKMDKENFPQAAKNQLKGFFDAAISALTAERYPRWHAQAGRLQPTKFDAVMAQIKDKGRSEAFINLITKHLDESLTMGTFGGQYKPWFNEQRELMNSAMRNYGAEMTQTFKSMDQVKAYWKAQLKGTEKGFMSSGDYDAYLDSIWDPAVISSAKQLNVWNEIKSIYGSGVGRAGETSGGGGGGRSGVAGGPATQGVIQTSPIDFGALAGTVQSLQKQGFIPSSEGSNPAPTWIQGLRNESPSGKHGPTLSGTDLGNDIVDKGNLHRAEFYMGLGDSIHQNDEATHGNNEIVAQQHKPGPATASMKQWPSGAVAQVSSWSRASREMADPKSPQSVIADLIQLTDDNTYIFQPPTAHRLTAREAAREKFPSMALSTSRAYSDAPLGSPEREKQTRTAQKVQDFATKFAWLTQHKNMRKADALKYIRGHFLDHTGAAGVAKWNAVMDKMERVRDYYGELSSYGAAKDSPFMDMQTYKVLNEILDANSGKQTLSNFSKTLRSKERHQFGNKAYLDHLRRNGLIVRFEMTGDDLWVKGTEYVAKYQTDQNTGARVHVGTEPADRHWRLEDVLGRLTSGVGHGYSARLDSMESLFINPLLKEQLAPSAADRKTWLKQHIAQLSDARQPKTEAEETYRKELLTYYGAVKNEKTGTWALPEIKEGKEEKWLENTWNWMQERTLGKIVEDRFAKRVLHDYASPQEKEFEKLYLADKTSDGVDMRRSPLTGRIMALEQELEESSRKATDPGKKIPQEEPSWNLERRIELTALYAKLGQKDKAIESLNAIEKILKDTETTISSWGAHREEFRELIATRFGALPLEEHPDYWTIGKTKKNAPGYSLREGTGNVLNAQFAEKSDIWDKWKLYSGIDARLGNKKFLEGEEEYFSRLMGVLHGGAPSLKTTTETLSTAGKGWASSRDVSVWDENRLPDIAKFLGIEYPNDKTLRGPMESKHGKWFSTDSIAFVGQYGDTLRRHYLKAATDNPRAFGWSKGVRDLDVEGEEKFWFGRTGHMSEDEKAALKVKLGTAKLSDAQSAGDTEFKKQMASAKRVKQGEQKGKLDAYFQSIQQSIGKTPEGVKAARVADMIKQLRTAGGMKSAIFAPIEGNIDLSKLKPVKMKSGKVGTVYSMSANINNEEVVIPTIINGKVVSEDEAIKHYLKTGKHLGKGFKSSEEASEFSKNISLLEAERVEELSKPAFEGPAEAPGTPSFQAVLDWKYGPKQPTPAEPPAPKSQGITLAGQPAKPPGWSSPSHPLKYLKQPETSQIGFANPKTAAERRVNKYLQSVGLLPPVGGKGAPKRSGKPLAPVSVAEWTPKSRGPVAGATKGEISRLRRYQESLKNSLPIVDSMIMAREVAPPPQDLHTRYTGTNNPVVPVTMGELQRQLALSSLPPATKGSSSLHPSATGTITQAQAGPMGPHQALQASSLDIIKQLSLKLGRSLSAEEIDSFKKLLGL